MGALKLSKNIAFDELTYTSRIDLLPRNMKEGMRFTEPLSAVAACLQTIRDYYGKPVVISSGYRCKLLNDAVGGSKTSQHLKGEAADFTVKGVSPRRVFEDMLTKKIMGCGAWSQVIYERKGATEWVHLGVNYSGASKAPTFHYYDEKTGKYQVVTKMSDVP